MKAQELFEQVTGDLIEAIESGASVWRMPWRWLGHGIPINVDGRPYRGWQRHDCQVRRGERSTAVVAWKPTNRPVDTELTGASKEDRDASPSRGLFARVFNVFAAE